MIIDRAELILSEWFKFIRIIGDWFIRATNYEENKQENPNIFKFSGLSNIFITIWNLLFVQLGYHGAYSLYDLQLRSYNLLPLFSLHKIKIHLDQMVRLIFKLEIKP